MAVKDFKVRNIVWFQKREMMDLENFLEQEIDVPLASNMIIRYIVMNGLKDKMLRKRLSERVNTMFEEKRGPTTPFVHCCSDCDFQDAKGEINRHRAGCPKYQNLAHKRMEAMLERMQQNQQAKEVPTTK